LLSSKYFLKRSRFKLHHPWSQHISSQISSLLIRLNSISSNKHCLSSRWFKSNTISGYPRHWLSSNCCNSISTWPKWNQTFKRYISRSLFSNSSSSKCSSSSNSSNSTTQWWHLGLRLTTLTCNLNSNNNSSSQVLLKCKMTWITYSATILHQVLLEESCMEEFNRIYKNHKKHRSWEVNLQQKRILRTGLS
jgi:hypothetical protein